MDIKTNLLKRFSKNMCLVRNSAVLIFSTFFLIGCALPHSFSDNEMIDMNPVIIEGVYECSSGNYTGLAVIRQKGDAYQIKWQINKQIFFGIGIREGNILSSNWFDGKGTVGIVVYKIESGPILKGKYSVFSGDGTIKTETLTRRRGLIPSDNASDNRIAI